MRQECMEKAMDDRKFVLMSIKPQYAKLIKSGEKTNKLRKIAPKVNAGDILIVYESMPVKRITAFCTIDEVIIAEPEKLWERANEASGLSHDSFMRYFEGKSHAAGIKLRNVHLLKEPKPLSAISMNLRAPQSYRYLNQKEFLILTNQIK